MRRPASAVLVTAVLTGILAAAAAGARWAPSHGPDGGGASALAYAPRPVANSICTALQREYGGAIEGYTTTFGHCLPAGFDPADQMTLFWVWFKVRHLGLTTYSVVKIDDVTDFVEGPYLLTKAEYDARKVDTRRVVK